MNRQTGLKDKNGVSIVEGDLVLHDWGDCKKPTKKRPHIIQKLGLVIWNRPSASFDIAVVGRGPIEAHREYYKSGDYRIIYGQLNANMIENSEGYSIWPDVDDLRCNHVELSTYADLTKHGFTTADVDDVIKIYYKWWQK